MGRAQTCGSRERVEAARLGIGAQAACDGLDRGVDIDAGDQILALEERAPGEQQQVGEPRVEQRVIDRLMSDVQRRSGVTNERWPTPRPSPWVVATPIHGFRLFKLVAP